MHLLIGVLIQLVFGYFLAGIGFSAGYRAALTDALKILKEVKKAQDLVLLTGKPFKMPETDETQ